MLDRLRRIDPYALPTKATALRAAHDGRPYWQARYYAGQVVGGRLRDFVTELEVDWSELEYSGKRNIIRLDLVCPDGAVAKLDVSPPADGTLFFQFKVGSVNVGVGLGTGPAEPSTRLAEAYVIGRIDDADTGTCTCFSWELDPASRGRYRLAHFRDTMLDGLGIMRFGPVAYRLSEDAMGVRL